MSTVTDQQAAKTLEKGYHRPVDPAPRGQAPRPGARDVLRRRAPARDGLRPLRPLAVRAREDRLHRRLQGARARGRVRDDHRRRGRDPDRPVLRDVGRAGREHQGLRARGRPRAAHGRAGRRRVRRDPRARARRRRPDRGRVRAAAGPHRRRGVAEERDDPPRRRGLERRLVGRVRLGRRRPGARGGRPRREDRAPALPPLLLDAARVRGRARRVRQGHAASGRSPATTRCPASARSGWRRRSAPGIDKLRFVTHDIGGGFGNKICLHPQYVVLCLLARKLGAAGAVDRVAHRPAHRERARERAHVPRRRGRR